MSEQTEAFRRWFRRANIYVPYLNPWQGQKVGRLLQKALQKAYMAGVKQGKKVK